MDAVESVLAEYPYQIFYRLPGDEGENPIGHRLSHNAGESIRVVYKDSIKPVTYQDSFTIPGTTLTYENVFLLRPGEVAEIDVPDEAIDYRIVECGVNTDVYSTVRVKELAADGIRRSGRLPGLALRGRSTRRWQGPDPIPRPGGHEGKSKLFNCGGTYHEKRDLRSSVPPVPYHPV